MKTTKDKELLKEYIVLIPENHISYEKYAITSRENFEWMDFCDCYDNYGQQLCHSEVCGSEDVDEYGNDVPKEELEHVQVLAYSYWDGSNWRSVIIDSDCSIPTDYTEEDEESSIKVLREMPDYPYIEGAVKTIETENFSFTATRYASFELFTVE